MCIAGEVVKPCEMKSAKMHSAVPGLEGIVAVVVPAIRGFEVFGMAG